MEHYITIEEYPDYEVSNLGNVRNKRTGTVRKQTNRNGYLKVRLRNKDESVHRLVADTFYDGDHSGLQVNHIDGNKTNNHISNLEWVTSSKNIKHAYDTGLKSPSGGIPPTKVRDGESGKTYDSISDCAKDIGGTVTGITYAIRKNQKYKNHSIKIVGDV